MGKKEMVFGLWLFADDRLFGITTLKMVSISTKKYHKYGHIDEYFCNQYEINEAVIQLHDLIKFGGNLSGQASGPYNLS